MASEAIIIQHDTMRRLHEHIEHARTKHPWPDDYPVSEIFKAMERENNEFAACCLKGDKRGALHELMDTAGLAVKAYEWLVAKSGAATGKIEGKSEPYAPDFFGLDERGKETCQD